MKLKSSARVQHKYTNTNIQIHKYKNTDSSTLSECKSPMLQSQSPPPVVVAEAVGQWVRMKLKSSARVTLDFRLGLAREFTKFETMRRFQFIGSSIELIQNITLLLRKLKLIEGSS